MAERKKTDPSTIPPKRFTIPHDISLLGPGPDQSYIKDKMKETHAHRMSGRDPFTNAGPRVIKANKKKGKGNKSKSNE